MSERRKAIAKQLIVHIDQREGLGESRPIAFPQPAITSAPSQSGIYRFCKDGQVMYIGKANNLRVRLNQHHRACKNLELARLIESGHASVAWRTTSFAGWWEDLELTEFKEEHGRLPQLNRISGGATLDGVSFPWKAIFTISAVAGSAVGGFLGFSTYRYSGMLVGLIAGVIGGPILASVLGAMCWVFFALVYVLCALLEKHAKGNL